MIHVRNPVRPGRYATIALSQHRSAQGPVIREYRDGRVTIEAGKGPVTGLPVGASALPRIRIPLFLGM